MLKRTSNNKNTYTNKRKKIKKETGTKTVKQAKARDFKNQKTLT